MKRSELKQIIREVIEEGVAVKKPKSWDSNFTMKLIKAYENGEIDLDDDESISDWETDYNGGKTPKPSLGSKEILKYALKIGKKPDGSPIK